MLYIALALSAILLVGINLTARSRWYWVVLCLFGGLALACFAPPLFTENYIPVAIVNALLLFPVALIWSLTGRRAKVMLALSCTATIIAYAIFLPKALRLKEEADHIVEKFPFESMEGRAPLAATHMVASSYDPKRLDTWEKEVEKNSRTYIQIDRTRGLKRLHDSTTQIFVESWGFGFERMPPSREYEFDRLQRNEPAPLQPTNGNYPPSPNVSVSLGDLEKIHIQGALDFLNPTRFGIVRDRQHVSGFESHGFTHVPDYLPYWDATKPREWVVSRLELVSLLMHPEPVVYLSERLPQMDALKGVPTRPLDAFETEGLAALRKGEDIFVREDRMLGAVRSTQQCLTCHGGNRGQLLGAFSYTIRQPR